MSAYFRYVEISRGGGQYEFKEEVHQQVLLPDFLFSKAYAQETRVHKETRYPLLHLGGNLLLENCSFRNNNSSAVRIGEQEMNFDNLSGPLVKIVNSNFENNKPGVAFSSEFDCPEKEESNCGNLFLLKNNWYDSPVGPNLIKINWEDYLKYLDSYESPLGYGERVVGEFVNIEGFRQKSLIADPLVIVPGIMGSAEEMVGKDLVLDPILHSYDEMVDSLKDNGYQEGVNLFTFPYNWRKSNVMTADKLSQKIQQIKQETGLMYVDIAAHSMGGLVARQYIQRKGYSYDVDQLITMGTPHKGSPKAYLMWEGGEFPGGLGGGLIKHHYTREAKHKGYEDLQSYIREKVLSVRELLPDYNYLFDVKEEEMREYPEDYPRNYFLEELNSHSSLQDFKQNKFIRFTNIVGKLKEDRTLTALNVLEGGGSWEHGRPENFGDKMTNQGLIFGPGDETVPLDSANGISAGRVFEVESNHTDLPTKSQCHVFQELTGEKVCEYDEDLNFPNVLLFNVLSPIDIQVVSPSGKVVGKDFESGEAVNEIDLAYYSGFDTQEEFITIPNFEEGKYKIKTEGTGEGEFRVEAVSLREKENGEIEERIEKSVEGVASAGKREEFEFAVGSEDEGESGGDSDQSSVIGDHGENNQEDGSNGSEGDNKGLQSPVISHQSEDNAGEEEDNQSSPTEGQDEESHQSSVIGDQDQENKEDEGEGDDENESDYSSVIGDQDKDSNQSSVVSHQDEKDKDSQQLSAIGDQEEDDEKESGGLKQKDSREPVVMGEKTENNPWVIAGMLFFGAAALIFIWREKLGV